MNEMIKKPPAQPTGTETGNARKVYIKTYGCQMNEYDSIRMGDALAAEGYVRTDDRADADLVVINTCHIREKAVEKVYSELGRFRKLKDDRAKSGLMTQVAVTGCVAQAEGHQILARAPVVDVIAGPQAYHRLGEYVARAQGGERVVATSFDIEEKFRSLPAAEIKGSRAKGVAAFLTIQEGCDKFCSFCVVPYTRGEEVSRKGAEILAEARRLADSGVREITLLGQNVNAWHGRGENGESLRLGELLAMLSEIGGIERLRYTTSHPIDMDESLIAAHRDLPKLMPYLHLPVQSGSDRILKAMNRRHTREYYFEVVAKVRQACPHIALSGDFIAGFPGETEDDFAQTMDLIEKVGYAQSFSFKYSRRPGTPGADLAGQIDEDAKTQRLKQMQALLNRQHAQFNAGVLGKTFDILLERPGRGASQLIGRSPYLQPVIVDASAGKIGDIVKVRIIETGPLSLKAEPVS